MPDRFRFKDPADQAIALIAKSRGVSLAQAAKLYEGTPAGTPAAPATPAEDPALKAYDTQLAELDTKLKKLSTDRKTARDDVDTEKADSLSDEIADVKTEIKLLTNERKGFVRNRDDAVTQTAQQQVIASRDRALAEYTELSAEGSLHRLALDSYVNRALGDPNRAHEFNDPAWPEKITAEFAQAHGLKKAGAAPAAPAPTPAPPPPAPLLRPLPRQVPGAKLVDGADGSSPSAAGPTLADLKAALPQMNAAQRREVIRRIAAVSSR